MFASIHSANKSIRVGSAHLLLDTRKEWKPNKEKKRKTTEKCWQTARVAAVKRESLISGATAPPGRPQRPKRRRVRGQWMDRVAHSGVAFSYLSMEAKTSRRARRVEGKRQRNDRVRFFFSIESSFQSRRKPPFLRSESFSNPFQSTSQPSLMKFRGSARTGGPSWNCVRLHFSFQPLRHGFPL